MEQVAVVDAMGTVVLYKQGQADRVTIRRGDWLAINGNRVVHWHPPQTTSHGVVQANLPPSPADLILLAGTGVPELRVVTADYRFVVKPIGRLPLEWVDAARQRLEQEVFRLVQQQEERLRRMLPAFSSGESNRVVDLGFSEIQHQAWKNIAPEIGVAYRRERRHAW